MRRAVKSAQCSRICSSVQNWADRISRGWTTTCPAIDGIIKEANEVAGEIADKSVLDAALIASAQAVEHYEITRYGTLIAWANQLGRGEVAAILKETLDEEYATDDKLTKMAVGRDNAKAAAVTEPA